MNATHDCDCILAQTDYCEECGEWVKDCPCWQRKCGDPGPCVNGPDVHAWRISCQMDRS